MKTRKKSLPDEKNPEMLPISGQKIQYISFWRKTSKNKKYGVVAGIFHKHAITKHSRIRYQNTHNLLDLHAKKNGNDSVNFIDSFNHLVMSNILDIIPLAAGVRSKASSKEINNVNTMDENNEENIIFINSFRSPFSK